MIDVAARQGDARGDDAQAIAVLDAGLIRYPDTPPIEVFEALLYRAELKARIEADTSSDLAAASALLAAHELGAEADRALTVPGRGSAFFGPRSEATVVAIFTHSSCRGEGSACGQRLAAAM